MKYCPVCSNPAGRGTFKCVGGCPEDTWVHPKCGGYGRREVQIKDPLLLTCNNCKKGGYKMTGGGHMPSLAELFNKTLSAEEQISKSSNIPSLSELLKNASSEDTNVTPLSTKETKICSLKSDNLGSGNHGSMLFSDQCTIPSLSKLSCSPFGVLNESSLGEHNDHEKFTSLNELSNSPRNFISLNELSNSPGKYTSLNELSNSPGKCTSLNELSNSPRNFMSLNELSNSPGKYTSLNELSNSPGKYTSLNELGNISEKCTSLYPDNELRNSPEISKSCNEHVNTVGKLTSRSKLNKIVEQNIVGNAMSLSQSYNESVCAPLIEMTSKDDDGNDHDKVDTGDLPTLLNMLSVNHKQKSSCGSINDGQEVKSVFPDSHAKKLNPPVTSLCDYGTTRLESSMMSKQSLSRVHSSIVQKPSNFSKVVCSRLEKMDCTINVLHDELKETCDISLPKEVMLTNIVPDLMDQIFLFSTPSPDDIVLSHQKKAFKRDY